MTTTIPCDFCGVRPNHFYIVEMESEIVIDLSRGTKVFGQSWYFCQRCMRLFLAGECRELATIGMDTIIYGGGDITKYEQSFADCHALVHAAMDCQTGRVVHASQ